MVKQALKFIKPILAGVVRTCDVKEDTERRWTADVQRALDDSVWSSEGYTSCFFKEIGQPKTVNGDGNGNVGTSSTTNSTRKLNVTLCPSTQAHLSLRGVFT